LFTLIDKKNKYSFGCEINLLNFIIFVKIVRIMNTSSYNPFTLIFRNKETEQYFLKNDLKLQQFQIKLLLTFVLVTVSYSALRQIINDSGQIIFLIQKLLFVAFAAFQLIYPFVKKEQFNLQHSLLFITGTVSLMFVAFKAQTGIDITGNLFLGIVILQIVAVFLLFAVRFFHIVITALLFLLIYEFSPFFTDSSSASVASNMDKLLIYTTVFFSGFTAYVNERNRRNSFIMNHLLKKSNKKLREYSNELSGNEQITKKVLQQMSELIISVSAEGNILFWNQRCYELTGYTQDEVTTAGGLKQLFPDEASAEKNLRLFTGTIRPKQFETRINAKDGSRKIISWKTIKPYEYISESPNWFAGKDITEEYDTWKELQKTEQKLRQTQDLARIGTWEWEPGSGNLYWSEQMYKMFRTDPLDSDSDAEKIFSALINELDLSKLIQGITEGAEKYQSKFTYEYPIVLNSSEERIMHLQGQIIYNDKGQIIRIFGTNQDITSIKRAEKSLINIRKSLEYAQKISKIGNIEYDPNDQSVYVSKEVKRIFGLDGEAEFSFPEHLKAYLENYDYDMLCKFLQDTTNAPSTLNSDIEVTSENGRQKILTVIGETYIDERERRIRSVIFQDNTELRLAINALQESNLKIQNILSSSPDTIIVFDPDFIIREINNAAEKIFGYSASQLLSASVQTIFAQTDYSDFTRTVNQMDSTYNTVKNREFDMVRASGDFFPAEISMALIPKSEQGEKLYVSIIKDITSRKIFEDNLNEARQKAEEADKLKSAFLANMSHEIRTPMNAIVGFSNMLTDEDISEKEREEYSGYIASNSSILLTLIDDIIDISKIEAGQLKIKQKTTTVAAIMDEVTAPTKEHLKMYDKSDIELITDCDNALRETPIKTDKTRVIQVLTNLLTNAAKFTEQGHILCKAGIVKIYDKKFLRFQVSDTGIGIRAENIDKIFNQFYRIEHNDVSEYRGTGLGLALSKKLLTLMGGKIEVESEAGKGSTFTFYIPYRPAPEALSDNALLSTPRRKNNWKGKTIIIAEDDFTNYKFLESLFMPTGATLIHAHNGREAIDFFQSEPDTDIILMDIRMPEVDGYEATQKIKSMKPEIPIIAVTAFAMEGEKQEIMNFQFDDYVSKPINNEQLFSKMNFFMDRNSK
jgi:PAS domain S-box-containing protein